MSDAPEPPPALLESLRARVRELEAALAAARGGEATTDRAPSAATSPDTTVLAVTTFVDVA